MHTSRNTLSGVGEQQSSPTPPHKLFGILGHSLGHSLSPVLHTWSFQRIGVPAVYLVWEVKPEALPVFMQSVRVLPIDGASVTIPHKEAVIPYLDDLSESARRIGAVNTLLWRDNRLLGENTDIVGFLSPIKGRSFASAMVLGAGGAARAVLAGLKDLGVDRIFITNRSADRAQKLAREFEVTAVPWEERTAYPAELLVNATPLGMLNKAQNETPWPPEAFEKGQTAYDLVYNPLKTRFLREAEDAGCDVVDGLAMFLGQAAQQCRLWTEKELPTREGRELLVAKL